MRVSPFGRCAIRDQQPIHDGALVLWHPSLSDIAWTRDIGSATRLRTVTGHSNSCTNGRYRPHWLYESLLCRPSNTRALTERQPTLIRCSRSSISVSWPYFSDDPVWQPVLVAQALAEAATVTVTTLVKELGCHCTKWSYFTHAWPGLGHWNASNSRCSVIHPGRTRILNIGVIFTYSRCYYNDVFIKFA